MPESVVTSLKLAAGDYGFVPRRSRADYVRKGPDMSSWAGWAWQEALQHDHTAFSVQFSGEIMAAASIASMAPIKQA